MSTSEPISPAPPASEPDGVPEPAPGDGVTAAAEDPAPPAEPTLAPPVPAPVTVTHRHEGVRPAGDCGCGCGGSPNFVYAIGTIGVDYGTEARRDGFRQSMDRVTVSQGGGGSAPVTAPANPYDPFQLGRYLGHNPWASDKVIWTLNLDRTPIYALQAEAPVGMTWGMPVAGPQVAPAASATDAARSGEPAPAGPGGGAEAGLPPVSYVYKALRDAFAGQALPDTDPNYVSRVSIPGVLTDRTVRLFSGQVVPVVLVRGRGLYTWNEQVLVDATTEQVMSQSDKDSALDRDTLAGNVRAFLDKVYYQFRNLGQSSADRALNFAATNAFMFTDEIRDGILSGQYVPGPNSGLFTLDTISVQKSPYCRMDSDCWDVQVTFFDPENDRRARVSYLFTIDVSDELPVSLAPSHRFLINS